MSTYSCIPKNYHLSSETGKIRDYDSRIEELRKYSVEDEILISEKSIKLFKLFISAFPRNGALSLTPSGFLYFTLPSVSLVFLDDNYIKVVKRPLKKDKE
jgi:hypothetical protein